MNLRGINFKNPYFAIHKKDKFFVGYFLSLGLFSLFYTMFVVLPHQYTSSSSPLSSSSEDYKDINTSSTHHLNNTTTYYLHYLLLIFLHVNIYINFYKIITNSSHLNPQTSNNDVVTPVTPTTLRSKKDVYHEEDVCLMCGVVKPKRSHHCRRCDICVKKRNHHCALSGGCIGYNNQRYYTSMMIYIFITSSIFNYYHLPMTLNLMNHLEPVLTPLYLLTPHILLILGTINISQFLLCLLTIKGIAIQCFSCAILIHQLIIIINGQTRHERQINMMGFDKGYIENLREVFGMKWYVAWACPLVESALPGDGLHFEECSKIV